MSATTRIFRYPASTSGGYEIDRSRPVHAALGNFEGLHLGHQRIISRLGDGVPEAQKIVISFYPHPAKVLGLARDTSTLCSLRQEHRILSTLGIQAYYLVHFTKALSECSAEFFANKVLFEALGVTRLVIGPDARIGHGRVGDSTWISKYFSEHGREVSVVPFVEVDGRKIGSGGIRELIRAGKVEEAGAFLGRRFSLESRVVHGHQRGSKIGIPTANLCTSKQVLPSLGVYATQSVLNGQRYPSVTNVGVRPTFGASHVVVETHLLSYQGPTFYGERMEVEFVSRIRDEIKFSGIDQLVAQIKLDCLTAMERLKS